MQGRFNLNWLVTPMTSSGTPGPGAGNPPPVDGGGTGMPGAGQPDPQAVAAFRKLLESVNVDPKWVDMLVDWIDTDNQPQTQGAEDSAYLGQNPPYLAANQYITSTTELLALPGFGRENYEKLAPYIAALPPASTLNLCTAKGKVLDAFIPGSSSEWSDEATLQKNRASAGQICFPKVTDYSPSFGSKTGTSFNSSRFTSTSNYFRLSSLVTIGSAEFNLYSLLFLDSQNFVHPIQRSFSPD
jgi:general secretion pathway protein K